MSKPESWISHIEAFVNSSLPSNQQYANVDAIAALVKNDFLKLETVVREMELYLTTTDHIIRARGTLLLGEILNRLTSKPLGSATISSLIEFFMSRLADWQALRGALVGCLALLRRKSNVGIVVGSDAKRLIKSYLTNVRAQSLAVHDRKLCFEVLQCFLDVYPEAVTTMGEEVIQGTLDAIDEEKDPRCLMLTFHLLETLSHLFPYPSNLIDSYAEEISDILGCYFPIYFTHPGSDGFEIKRDDLSRALMNAFSSLPYLEPFVIPLLVDKLSSSLPLAKLDSLKYLKNCIVHYPPDRMLKHAKAIWSALKDVIFNLPPQGIFVSTSESVGEMESEENQIAKEAFICLQLAISQLNCHDRETFISLILDDNNIEKIFESVCFERSYSGISKKDQQQLSSLGSILSVSSKVSADCCSRVFRIFFPRLMNILEISSSDLSYGCITDCKVSSKTLNFGSLYLCIELLISCKDLAVAVEDLSLQSIDSCWYLLNCFLGPLTCVLRSSLVNLGSAENTGPEYVSYVVKGLQVLAMFPTRLSPASEGSYEDILSVLTSVIIGRFDDTFLWKSALEAVVQIGLYVEKIHDSKKREYYNKIVVERIVSLLSHGESSKSLALKLEAISKIGVSGPDFMLTVIQGLEEAIFSNFSEACFNGNQSAAEILVPLLECYSNRVLSRCDKPGMIDKVAMHFAFSIWNLVENSSALSKDYQGQGILDTIMMAMKLVVGYCSKENQGALVQKAYSILSSARFHLLEQLQLPLAKLEPLQTILDTSSLSPKDEWIVSLFSSVVIALHPDTPLPNIGALIRVFSVFLLKGHIPATQALASLINKWLTDSKTEQPNAYKLEEVIDEILESLSTVLCCPLQKCKIACSTDDTHRCLNPSSLQIHALVGLAWIGKGLLMRGHDKVKEISLLLLKSLLSSRNIMNVSTAPDESGKSKGQDMHFLVSRSAADAFSVLLSDSEVCLNKRFHATIRPLYKQRFFSSMMPVLLSSIKEHNSSSIRADLYRALGHIISNTPLAAVVAEAKKIIPPLLEGLSILSTEVVNKEMTYGLLLVLSGILMDENGKEAVIENAHIIINHLIRLITYPHMTLIRETAIQCLVAMSALPHTRIYPMRQQVLRALSNSLDDRKRVVRQEAVRCRQAWASIA